MIDVSSLIWAVVMIAMVLLMGRIGLFAFLSLARWMDARLEHRDGPGMGGKFDLKQVWTDYRKSREKNLWPSSHVWAIRPLFSLWSLLPGLFFVVLMLGGWWYPTARVQIPLLLFILLLGLVIEGFFVIASMEGRERGEWLGGLILRILAITVIALGVYTVTIHGSEPGFSALASQQTVIPFVPLFGGPGTALAAIPCFLAIFLFSGRPPLSGLKDPSLGSALHERIIFVRSAWVLCLVSFWVALFFANPTVLLGVVLFGPLVTLASFFHLLLARSIASIRVIDAYGLCLKWMVPLSLAAFLLEVAWIGARMP